MADMADQDEPQSLASTFPNPPPFWKDFTPDATSRISELRERYLESTGIGADDDEERTLTLRLPDVPDDLVNLQPPAEPSDGKWRVFGDHYTLDDQLPTLEDQGITNLPATAGPAAAAAATSPADPRKTTHQDRALELKRLAKSLLLNFLELAGTLSRSPAHAEAKAQDLRTLFINMHHILNEYRPHQARESAIDLMQTHLDKTRAETMAVKAQVQNARQALRGLGSLDPAMLGPGARKALDNRAQDRAEADERALQRERAIWAAADALLS